MTELVTGWLAALLFAVALGGGLWWWILPNPAKADAVLRKTEGKR
ncbi:hypothetical protein GCM10011581_12450 [Saccharopolyspora subtropica]|uniref:Uncharacterized protein n=1 Tax=Saccharopolyspora thermophila TaxID=89367 RepID=A0A917JPF9_9PSEU|nr:hypothetical protein [Saccharopolyspora subtropica]GGI76863.1 hypothetical protein GCM10011581_12450 [Saccharopolyspora subtropica]